MVVSITKVIKHPNADALCVYVTSAGDYPIVGKIGDYTIGDLAVMIPIDSVVPDTEQFYFLCPRLEVEGAKVPRYEIGNVPVKYRTIKAKRLRGVYSQGMLVPVNQEVYDAFAATLSDQDLDFVIQSNFQLSLSLKEKLIGYPVDKLLNIFKMEEDEEEASDPIAKKKSNGGSGSGGITQNERNPVGWSMPYYDIGSIRKHVNALKIGEEVVLSEKIHGANAGFSYDGNRLWVKSRNFYKRGDIEIPVFEEIPEGVVLENRNQRKQVGTKVVQSTDQWWQVARRNGLEVKLSKYPGMVFYGEVYGQVSGFQYDAPTVEGRVQSRIRFFDIWDTKRLRYLDYDDFCALCTELELDMAPVIYAGPWLGKESMYPYAEGKTLLGGKHIREGFVLRPRVERICEETLGRLQFKLVSEAYNLQK
jgi:RNA ligase (TIGR02306 family)